MKTGFNNNIIFKERMSTKISSIWFLLKKTLTNSSVSVKTNFNCRIRAIVQITFIFRIHFRYSPPRAAITLFAQYSMCDLPPSDDRRR